MTSRLARHGKIRQLLAAQGVTSQAELQKLMADDGFHVTQATLSRDLELLEAVKVPGPGGRAHYVIPDSATGVVEARDPLRLARTLSDMVEAIDFSGNMVVIKTPVGAASYIARAIDRSGMTSVLGTVAGDDTVMVVTRDPNGGEHVSRELMELAKQ
ncbi:MAG: arginine repressor [Actinomycetes bacterium]